MMLLIATAVCAGPAGYDPAQHHCMPASAECQRAFASGETQYRDERGVTHLCPLSKAPAALRGDPPEPVGDDASEKDSHQ